MVIAVDFDGTIVEHKYPRIGKPVPFAIEVLKQLQKDHILILWTVREGELLENAVRFCADRGLRFYAVNKNYPGEQPGENPRKLDADLFIDDRNIGGLPDWKTIYEGFRANKNPYALAFRKKEKKHKKKKNRMLTRLKEFFGASPRRNY
jgi:hypothetical protein